MVHGGTSGLRALVVDDEEPALAEMKFRLEELQDQPFSQVDTAASAGEAVRRLKAGPYDVLFLDVQMPGVDGLELAEIVSALPRPPSVVFVTAFDEYAVRAFDLRAVDYLMKPVAPERLRRTVERLRASAPPGHPDVQSAPAATLVLDRLPVESAGRTMLIDVAEIRYAEARGDLVSVKTRDKLYATRFSLTELEKRLPQPPFLRIHRAFIANLRCVVEIRPYFNGAYLLKANDDAGTELTVSRGHARDLRTLLGF